MNRYLLLTLVLFSSFVCFSADDINGDKATQTIKLSGAGSPKPHMAEVAEPQAYYAVSTATLSIELDPVYYSQYTIIIQSDYASLDYIVTSPVVNIPVGSLDSVVDIYIESDDCGCYYGTLNQSAYNSTF